MEREYMNTFQEIEAHYDAKMARAFHRWESYRRGRSSLSPLTDQRIFHHNRMVALQELLDQESISDMVSKAIDILRKIELTIPHPVSDEDRHVVNARSDLIIWKVFNQDK
jgi:hypothetical protein